MAFTDHHSYCILQRIIIADHCMLVGRLWRWLLAVWLMPRVSLPGTGSRRRTVTTPLSPQIRRSRSSTSEPSTRCGLPNYCAFLDLPTALCSADTPLPGPTVPCCGQGGAVREAALHDAGRDGGVGEPGPELRHLPDGGNLESLPPCVSGGIKKTNILRVA